MFWNAPSQIEIKSPPHTVKSLSGETGGGQFFYGTQIPVCLWFLAKNKTLTPTRLP